MTNKYPYKTLIGAVVFALLVTILGPMFLYSSPPCSTISNLDDFDKIAVSVYTEMNRYLSAITSVVLGLLGTIVFMFFKKEMILRIWPVRILTISFVFGVISLYYGYVSHFAIIEGSINKCIEIEDERYQYPQLIQYYSMLIAFISALSILLLQFIHLEKNK